MPKQLIIQLARFGDIIQTKRLFLSLRRQGEVHLCVDASLEGLARMIYPDAPVHGLPAHGSLPGAVLARGRIVLEGLKAERFDAVYALNYAGLSRALAAMFDPAIVRGYPVASGQPLRSNWMRLAFRWMADRAAAPLNLVDFWAALAPHVSGADMLPPERVNPAAKPGGKGLGVVLSGQNARRSLPAELLAPVVHAVFDQLEGPNVWLLGGAAEEPAARRLLGRLPSVVAGKTANLAGRTDWAALADALTGLDRLLSPDTGTVHLAAHLGVPVEGLYCSSAWAFETGPYGVGHRVWQTLMDCSPCVESSPCPRDASCRAAYGQAPFLARLQGKSGGAAARPLMGLVPLQSGFDAMGETWAPAPGEIADPYAKRRAAMRALLAEYRGLAPADRLRPEHVPPGTLADTLSADTFYEEADWMLPQCLP